MSRLAVTSGSSPHVFDAGSETFPILEEALSKSVAVKPLGASHGRRGVQVNEAVGRVQQIGGKLVLPCSPAVLDAWLPRIFGGDPQGNGYALAVDLPTFGLLIDRDGATYEYENARVSKATIRANASSPAVLLLEIAARNEEPGPAFPSILPVGGGEQLPYAFSSAELTLRGRTREIQSLELTIDNRLTPRYVHSVLPTSLTPSGRVVALQARVAADAFLNELYDDASADLSGELSFAAAGRSTEFQFGALQTRSRKPSSGRSEDGFVDFTAAPMQPTPTTRLSSSTRRHNDRRAFFHFSKRKTDHADIRFRRVARDGRASSRESSRADFQKRQAVSAGGGSRGRAAV